MIFLYVKAHLLPDMLDGVHLVPRGEIYEGDPYDMSTTGRYLSGVSYPPGFYNEDVLQLHWYNVETNSVEIEDVADWEDVYVAVESWTEELANEVL